jgi:hypothetical protein
VADPFARVRERELVDLLAGLDEAIDRLDFHLKRERPTSGRYDDLNFSLAVIIGAADYMQQQLAAIKEGA